MHIGCITAGLRLGKRPRANPVAAGEPRNDAPNLGRAAVAQDVADRERVVRREAYRSAAWCRATSRIASAYAT